MQKPCIRRIRGSEFADSGHDEKDGALQSGIQLAVAAEAKAEGRSDVEASTTLSNQAIYFFLELDEESRYKIKAQVHLESIRVRSILPPLPSRIGERKKEDDDSSLCHQYRELESKISMTVEKLFAEELVL